MRLSIAALVCAGVTVAVLQVGFGRDYLFGLARLADLNGEHNLPTWFSSAQLLAAGVASLMLAVMSPGRRRSWQFLAAVMVLLSLDEAAGLHELLNRSLRSALNAGPAFHFPWVVVGAVFAATVAVVEIRLVLSLPRVIRVRILSAGICYVLGSIGFEMMAAPLYAAGRTGSAAHAALVVMEETLEMSAIALFLVALLRHGATERLSMTVTFEDRSGVRYGARAGMRVPPRRVTRAMSAVVAALAAVSLGTQMYAYRSGASTVDPLVRLVNLTREGNIPTWWQASTLLACGALAFVITVAQFRSHATFRKHWAVVAIAFTYMSLDEAAGIHELTVRPLRETFNTTGLLYYPWVLIGAAVSILALVALRAFIAHLPRRTRRLLSAAAVVFLGGALGVEAVSGLFAEAHGRTNIGYTLLTTVEETLEMVGVLLAARALMEFIRDHVGVVRFGRSEPPQPAV